MPLSEEKENRIESNGIDNSNDKIQNKMVERQHNTKNVAIDQGSEKKKLGISSIFQ